MTLDVNTLFLVTIYVEAILGLLLLFAWVQNSEITAVAWWGSAHLLRAGVRSRRADRLRDASNRTGPGRKISTIAV